MRDDTKSHVYDGFEDEPFGPRPWQQVSEETAIADILHAKVEGAMFAEHYHRVEQSLITIFGRLSVADARELRGRFTLPTADDVLAARFNRLVIDRRQRLITFLDAAPRRAALQGLK